MSTVSANTPAPATEPNVCRTKRAVDFMGKSSCDDLALLYWFDFAESVCQDALHEAPWKECEHPAALSPESSRDSAASLPRSHSRTRFMAFSRRGASFLN